MSRARQCGFTLLELLVGLALLSVLTVLTWGGLRNVLHFNQRLQPQLERIESLQATFYLMEQDLEQVLARPVRDALGGTLPALAGGDRLALTRAGWRNPLEQPRSSLQRVEYRLDDGILTRRYWPVLDRVPRNQPLATPLLHGVSVFAVRFMTGQQRWVPLWPPANMPPRLLPTALEVQLQIEGYGPVRRLLRVQG